MCNKEQRTLPRDCLGLNVQTIFYSWNQTSKYYKHVKVHGNRHFRWNVNISGEWAFAFCDHIRSQNRYLWLKNILSVLFLLMIPHIYSLSWYGVRIVMSFGPAKRCKPISDSSESQEVAWHGTGHKSFRGRINVISIPSGPYSGLSGLNSIVFITQSILCLITSHSSH